MNIIRTITIALLGLSLAACSSESGDGAEEVAMPAEPPAVENEPSNGEPAASANLAGTQWRLVKIQSMDDSSAVPQADAMYTLAFGDKGPAMLIADCNRGTGTWVSEAEGQLQFGPIAATQALCGPESISGQYLAQFQWVRSYTMNDGHLFLATMADGSIIEFEPGEGPAVAAVVFGEEVRTDDAAEMQQLVLTRLFDAYAAARGIEVTDEEITAFMEGLNRGLAEEGLNAEDDLSDEERVEVELMRQDMARSMIRNWKLNRALYAQYGGRVIYQQLGPEPLDAYRAYLEERQAAGDFEIVNEAFRDTFWRYFTNDEIHDFMQPEDQASAFETPPWDES